MRTAKTTLLPLLLSWGTFAFAQDCVPTFYNSEPRDAKWFYGAGKGADAQAARRDALDHLYLKIAGGETGVPRDVLAGWEQDDHGECRGVHYVIDRIEKERARKNLADALLRQAGTAQGPGSSSPVVVNNINVPPTPKEDGALRYLILLALFLAFAVACVAILRRPAARGPAPYIGGDSIPVDSPPKPRSPRAPSALTEKFSAVARQPQAEAMSEIAKTGITAYLKGHKGEGTCKSIPGSEELVRDGAREMARRYQAQGWKVTTADEWASFAVSAEGGVAMGFGFFVYSSRMTGYADCEILYAIGAGIDESYRTKMEEGLHQGLPWTVQAIAVRQGAAKSRDESPE